MARPKLPDHVRAAALELLALPAAERPSQRAIARRLGISHTSVQHLAGRPRPLGDYRRQPPGERLLILPVRCLACGGRTRVLPCRTCRLRHGCPGVCDAA